jgi:CBS-domain-containing membrane protein
VRLTARRMRENHLRRLLVLDEEGHLLGRVSLTDLARAVGRRAVMASRLRRLRARGVPSARRRAHRPKARAQSMQALALGA